MEKVSLIVPVYNIEKYLERCANSILEQDYDNLEIILVNDGSLDNSLKICKKYEQKDSRIIVIDKKNGGVSSARNEGLKIATGDYIGFIDSDDWIDKNTISTLMNVLKKENYDILICTSYNNDIPYSDKEIVRTLDLEETVKHCLKLENPVLMAGVCNKIFKANLLKEEFFDVDLSIGEDMFFLIKILLKSKKIGYVEKSLYHYFYREDSVTHVFSLKKLSNIKSHEKLMEIVKKNKNLLDIVEKRLIAECINMLRNCMNENIKDKNIILLLQKTIKKYNKENKYILTFKEKLLSYNYISFYSLLNLKKIIKYMKIS